MALHNAKRAPDYRKWTNFVNWWPKHASLHVPHFSQLATDFNERLCVASISETAVTIPCFTFVLQLSKHHRPVSIKLVFNKHIFPSNPNLPVGWSAVEHPQPKTVLATFRSTLIGPISQKVCGGGGRKRAESISIIICPLVSRGDFASAQWRFSHFRSNINTFSGCN